MGRSTGSFWNILRASETVWAERGPGWGGDDEVRFAPEDGDIDRRFGLPGPELQDVNGDSDIPGCVRCLLD